MGIAAHRTGTDTYQSMAYVGNWTLWRGVGTLSKKVQALDLKKGSFRELN